MGRPSLPLVVVWIAAVALGGACGKMKGAVSPPPGGDDAGIQPDAEAIAVVTDPSGFATQYMDPDGGATMVVSGGAGAPATNVYVVATRQQLLDALANKQSPTYATDPKAAQNEPKIIYVEWAIFGNQLASGTMATADTYRATPNPNQYDFDLYLKFFDTQYKAGLQAMADAGDATAAAQLALVNSMPGSARTTFSNNQKAQIQFQVPPNTSLLGTGPSAKIIDGYLSINTYSASFGQTLDSNIIIRNIEFEVPQDYAPAWDPTDTSTGAWNARYDGISIVTGRNIWIDHCTFSDGEHLDSAEPTPFNGKHVQRHDGLIDIEDGSDDITISYSVFRQHDKTTLIGSTGGGTLGQENYETGRERITFFANMWETSVQRAPLARWGQFHLFNNLYRGDLTDPQYPLLYFLGLGTSSSILSESNVFDIAGSTSTAVLGGRVFQASGGKLFHDVGSWLGDAPFTNIETLADQKAGAGASAAIGWTPPYPYAVGMTSQGVRAHVIANAGAGKLDIQPLTAGP